MKEMDVCCIAIWWTFATFLLISQNNLKWNGRYIYGYYTTHVYYTHILGCFKNTAWNLGSFFFLSKLMTHLQPKQKQLFSNDVSSSFVEFIKKVEQLKIFLNEWKNHKSSHWNSKFELTVWQSKLWKNRWLLEFALYHNEFDELDGCISNDIIKSKECEF